MIVGKKATALIEEELHAFGWSLTDVSSTVRAGQDAMVEFASLFGTPSLRDGGPIWPLQPVETTGTFSVRPGPAPLHTDAQYRDDPESRFLLFCVRAANSGGESTIVRLENLIGDLEAASGGPEVLSALHESVWQWKVPEVFQQNGQEIISSPHSVLSGDSIRWRSDNLVGPEDLMPIAKRFERLARDSPKLHVVPLSAGQVLLCDNSRVLHGRLPFSDPNRLLYRVRLS